MPKKWPEEFLCVWRIGATEVQQHDTPDTLFNRADKALYMAKHTGRNRVKTSIA
ncbi:MAG: diguanylate cyclase [Candidatus Hydrogenedentes bacterium]|nr:diguanylate cyclase [Candidatus Hydrogenedentota bacterium]